MSEKVFNAEKTETGAQNAGTRTADVTSTKIETLKAHRRDAINQLISGISKEQREQMRKEVAEELNMVEGLKRNLRKGRKEHWRSYAAIGGFGMIMMASVYAIASLSNAVVSNTATLAQSVIVISGILGSGFMPIFIYRTFSFLHDETAIGNIGHSIRLAKKRLKRLTFDESKKEML